jgi:hypothetical protein
MGSLCFFQVTYSFQPHFGPGIGSASNEMSTKNLPERKERPVRKAENLIAICEPIV